jgi:vacuolar-type H+-ATPase subunit C/Vma6
MSHLLDKKDIVRLLGARDLAEMNDLLLTSDYSDDVSRVPLPELTALQLERVFFEKLSKRWYALLPITSGKIRAMLENYNTKLEIGNLKRIIRAVHGKTSIDEEMLISIPREYQTLNFPALKSANNMADVLNLLKESPYKDLETQLDEYEKYGSPTLFETQLDKIYYSELFEKTRGLSDAKKVRDLLGFEADLRNLEFIVSSKYMKLEPRIVSESLIENGYRLRKTTVSSLISASIDEIPLISMRSSYSDLLKEAVDDVQEGKIIEMGNLFSRALYSYVEKLSIRNPNNLVYVFLYLCLCFREAKNLTTLAIGKQMKISEQRLSELLFL